MATLRPPPPGRRGRGARPTPVASRPLSSAPLPEASVGLAAPSAAENAALSARADASTARDEPRGGFQAARALFDGRQQRAAPSAPTVVTSVAVPVPEVEASSAAKEEPTRAASVRALISKLNSPAAAPKAAEKPAASARFAPRAAAPVAAVSQPAVKSPVEPPTGMRSPVQNAKALFEARSQHHPGPASTPTKKPATANSPVAAVSQQVAPAHTPRSPVQNAKALFEARAQPPPTPTPTPVTPQAATASPVVAVSQQVAPAHTPRSPMQNAKAVLETSRSPVQAAKAAFEARADSKSPVVPVPARRSSVQAAKAMFEARAEAPLAPPVRIPTPVARPPAPPTPASELAATVPVVAERAVPVPTPRSTVQAAKGLFESPAAPNPSPSPAPAPVVLTSMSVPVPVEPSPPSPAAWTPEVHPPSARTLPSSPATLPSDLPEFHPFKLLLPVTTVPLVPRSVDCVYDDAAIEMQKSVTKVAKKVFKKNKPRFEEFKVNARLYGSGFMDADEYLQSLITDFKPLRALQLVPCLASIQPDAVKRQNLLFAARGYRLRNLDALTSQCDSVDTQPTLVRSLSTDSTVSTVSTVSVTSNAPIEPAPAQAQPPAEPSPAQGQPPAESVPVQLDAPVEPLPVKPEAPVEFMAVPIESSAMAVPMSLPTPVEYEVVTKGTESAESVQQLTEAATPTAVVVEDHPAFKTSLMEPHVIVEPANEVQAIPVSELIAEPIETFNKSDSMSQSVEVVNMESKAPELQIDIVPSSSTGSNQLSVEGSPDGENVSSSSSLQEKSENVSASSNLDMENESSTAEAVSPVVEPPSASLPPLADLLKKELTQPQSECEPEAGPPSPVDNQSSSVKEVPQDKNAPTAKVLVQQRTDSLTSSDGEEGDQPSTAGMNLFGEVIEPTHQDKPADVTPSKEEVSHVVPTSSDAEDLFGGSNRVQAAPVVISDDEDDAFSLFGRPSSSTTSTPSKPRKSVTWGETQAKEIPARKSPPAPLIFGFATAGAYSDSDSDDSDFE